MSQLNSGAGEPACAKINLALHVTGQRADGYHLLQSLVVFADVADRISAEPAQESGLTVSGPFAPDLDGPQSDNLVLRAARSFLSEAERPEAFQLHLEKNLPVASGIGGGSADAAAVLRLLHTRFPDALDEATLQRLALDLGADVPVCLLSKPAIMSGIGEDLEPAPSLPRVGMVLINPGVGVSTPSVFKHLKTRENPPLPALPAAFESPEHLFSVLSETRNDLEGPARFVCPEIENVLHALNTDKDVRFARMSGSGATCFGLCVPGAETRIAARIHAVHPQWWVAAGRILTG